MSKVITQEDKDRLQYMIDVMQAFTEGKEIEYRSDGGWKSCPRPSWNWTGCNYRIKPEPSKPQYRPFESAEEVMEAIKEHGDWIALNGRYYLIIEVTDTMIANGSARVGMTFRGAIDATFLDGTPFGKLIEK